MERILNVRKTHMAIQHFLTSNLSECSNPTTFATCFDAETQASAYSMTSSILPAASQSLMIPSPDTNGTITRRVRRIIAVKYVQCMRYTVNFFVGSISVDTSACNWRNGGRFLCQCSSWIICSEMTWRSAVGSLNTLFKIFPTRTPSLTRLSWRPEVIESPVSL